MYILENDFIRVELNPVGAELSSLFNKVTGLEYLWNGDPAFWPKKSPTLFPVVGLLKDNKYIFENKSYQLGRHGFVREKLFNMIGQAPSSVSFELQDDDSTQAIFPFQFSFRIKYAIDESSLSVTYLVNNKGTEPMYFSVGGHPAFKLPLGEGLAYNDYYLLFNKTENAGRWPICGEGLIDTTPVPLLQNTDQLPLSKELFYQDAIVLKELKSDEVQLRSGKHDAGLSFSFKGFPYLGIWAAKDADFVCIEPWCGVADSVETDQLLVEKEGINELEGGEDFERTWSVRTW